MQTDRIGWAWFAFTEWKANRQRHGSGVGLGEYGDNL